MMQLRILEQHYTSAVIGRSYGFQTVARSDDATQAYDHLLEQLSVYPSLPAQWQGPPPTVYGYYHLDESCSVLSCTHLRAERDFANRADVPYARHVILQRAALESIHYDIFSLLADPHLFSPELRDFPAKLEARHINYHATEPSLALPGSQQTTLEQLIEVLLDADSQRPCYLYVRQPDEVLSWLRVAWAALPMGNRAQLTFRTLIGSSDRNQIRCHVMGLLPASNVILSPHALTVDTVASPRQIKLKTRYASTAAQAIQQSQYQYLAEQRQMIDGFGIPLKTDVIDNLEQATRAVDRLSQVYDPKVSASTVRSILRLNSHDQLKSWCRQRARQIVELDIPLGNEIDHVQTLIALQPIVTLDNQLTRAWRQALQKLVQVVTSRHDATSFIQLSNLLSQSARNATLKAAWQGVIEQQIAAGIKWSTDASAAVIPAEIYRGILRLVGTLPAPSRGAYRTQLLSTLIALPAPLAERLLHEVEQTLAADMPERLRIWSDLLNDVLAQQQPALLTVAFSYLIRTIKAAGPHMPLTSIMPTLYQVFTDSQHGIALYSQLVDTLGLEHTQQILAIHAALELDPPTCHDEYRYKLAKLCYEAGTDASRLIDEALALDSASLHTIVSAVHMLRHIKLQSGYLMRPKRNSLIAQYVAQFSQRLAQRPALAESGQIVLFVRTLLQYVPVVVQLQHVDQFLEHMQGTARSAQLNNELTLVRAILALALDQWKAHDQVLEICDHYVPTLQATALDDFAGLITCVFRERQLASWVDLYFKLLHLIQQPLVIDKHVLHYLNRRLQQRTDEYFIGDFFAALEAYATFERIVEEALACVIDKRPEIALERIGDCFVVHWQTIHDLQHLVHFLNLCRQGCITTVPDG